MHQIYNAGFIYPNLGHGTTQCNLQVYAGADVPTVAIATELPANQGTSVTNAIERIANIVCRQFAIPLEDLILIEHYPAHDDWGGRPPLPETFSRVLFEIRHGFFQRPQWIYLRRAEVESLIGQSFGVNIE